MPAVKPKPREVPATDLREVLRLPPGEGLPKYRRLRDALAHLIEQGGLKPGDKLPGEAELTRVTPFSLGTVQRALAMLTDEGILVRTHGAGTFVAEPRKQIDPLQLLRFLAEDGQSILPLYSTVLSRKRIAERGPWSEPLRQQRDDVIRIERVLDVNGEFAVYALFFGNVDRLGPLLTLPIARLNNANLKELLRRELHVSIARIAQRIRMGELPRAVTAALRLKPKVRGMTLEAIAFTDAGEPVLYQELYIPPTSRRLLISE